MKLLLIFGIILVTSLQAINADKHVVCYVPNWLGVDMTQYIDQGSCTIFVIAFGTMDTIGNVDKSDLNGLEKLKASNNKVLISFGGYNAGSTYFGPVAATDASRKTFANNVLQFVKANNFDGVDIDWEYPETADEKQNYVLLLQQLKDTLGSNLLVTVAISADVNKYTSIKDGMVKALDYIFLMTYDMHGSWDALNQGINFNAPLLAASGKWSSDYAVNNYLNAGFPASIFVVVVPFYGNSYTLTGSATTPGSLGTWAGTVTYQAVCVNFQSWTVVMDPVANTPYMYSAGNWIAMENSDSILAKGMLANKYQLAGVMTWSIDQDDYKGTCGSCKWPLLKALNAAVGRGQACDGTSISTTTGGPTQPTTAGPTTNPTTVGPTTTLGPNTKCASAGLFKYPPDCTKFYNCAAAGETPFIMDCGAGTFWDDSVKTCGTECV